MPVRGYLFSQVPAIGKISWITPCWYTVNQKSYGMQFCWRCLKEDVNPYFRRKWRLSFVVNCNKHKIVLSDRCHQCSEPINYFRTPQNNKIIPVHFCSFCGFDLRKTSSATQPDAPSSIELEYQTHLEDVLKEGWVENQIGFTYSYLYFKGIYSLMRSLCEKSAEDFCKIVAEFYKIDGLPPELFNPAKSLESYSIAERRFLNILVSCIITDWHQDFVELCKGNKSQSKKLTNLRDVYFLFWYWEIINDYISPS